MHMIEFLETIRCRPNVAGSPPLHVREDDLWDFDLDTIRSSPYSRAPYAIVEGLFRSTDFTFDAGESSMTGSIDVSILQLAPSTPDSNGARQDPEPVAQVMARVMNARRKVTELTPGYPLQGHLTLIDETRPTTRDQEGFTGLIATARFSYRIHR